MLLYEFPSQRNEKRNHNCRCAVPPPSLEKLTLAPGRTRQRGMRQRSFIRKAECAVDCVRLCAHLKPLQQRFSLRVIGKCLIPFLEGYCHRGIGQYLDGVASFQVILANLRIGRDPWELPYRRNVVDERLTLTNRGMVKLCFYNSRTSALFDCKLAQAGPQLDARARAAERKRDFTLGHCLSFTGLSRSSGCACRGISPE
jgi:hypothetical protein